VEEGSDAMMDGYEDFISAMREEAAVKIQSMQRRKKARRASRERKEVIVAGQGGWEGHLRRHEKGIQQRRQASADDVALIRSTLFDKEAPQPSLKQKQAKRKPIAFDSGWGELPISSIPAQGAQGGFLSSAKEILAQFEPDDDDQGSKSPSPQLETAAAAAAGDYLVELPDGSRAPPGSPELLPGGSSQGVASPLGRQLDRMETPEGRSILHPHPQQQGRIVGDERVLNAVLTLTDTVYTLNHAIWTLL